MCVGASVSAYQDPGWLLLLCIWSPRASGRTRPLLRGDGPQYDQHHTVKTHTGTHICITWSFTVTLTCFTAAVMFVGSCSRRWTWGSASTPVRFFVEFWEFRSGSLTSGAGTSTSPTVWRLQECRGQKHTRFYWYNANASPSADLWVMMRWGHRGRMSCLYQNVLREVLKQLSSLDKSHIISKNMFTKVFNFTSYLIKLSAVYKNILSLQISWFKIFSFQTFTPFI